MTWRICGVEKNARAQSRRRRRREETRKEAKKKRRERAMEVESDIAIVPTVLDDRICISVHSCVAVVYSFNIWILQSYTY